MGRRALIELGYAGAGLALALGITWAAAWAYPLGRQVIWAVGAVAAAVVVAMNVRPVRQAMTRDRRNG